MNKEIAVLFDLDGVIIDTEPQYDIFWKKIGKEYLPEIEDLEQKVKGRTMPEIMSKFFSHLSKEESHAIERANHEWDLQMDLILIPGVMEFLSELKANNIKMGLVTSSDNEKLDIVFRKLPLRRYFGTIVPADRITQGKPHPMCYLLAASDLDFPPEKCIVFEDSFYGIKAGTDARMTVVGLSTTNPEEQIKDQVAAVIPDFKNFSMKNMKELV